MKKTIMESLLVPTNIAIKHAMNKLTETSEKILFVVDNNDRNLIVGTVTDGDIRRGLLDGLSFTDRIEKVMCRDFTFISADKEDKKEIAQKIMHEEKIEQIPVLDKKRHIIDVILWTDVFFEDEVKTEMQFKENSVVIMAGGKGTRLAPFTNILPKSLMPIGDKAVLEIIMEKFYKYGFKNFILVLNYKKDYIKAFLKEKDFPYNISWVEEDDFRGTAGGLSLLADDFKETFIVSNCDVIVDADFEDLLDWHKKHRNLMTLVGCHKEIKIPYGVLKLGNEKLHSLVEKPLYDVIINTGIYVLEPEVISLIDSKEAVDMNVLIDKASQKGKVSVYSISNGWFDIGQLEEYKNTLKKLTDL